MKIQISAKWLEEQGACNDQVEIVRKAIGNKNEPPA